MFDTDSSEDEQTPVCDNMDTMNNSEEASDNIELESVAQEADETADLNQLVIDKLISPMRQLSVDKSSDNLTQTFDNAILVHKNQFGDHLFSTFGKFSKKLKFLAS